MNTTTNKISVDLGVDTEDGNYTVQLNDAPCVCNPVLLVDEDTGVPVIVHSALDGRE